MSIMATMDQITYSEFNDLHFRLGGTRKIINAVGHVDVQELASFIFNVEQELRPKQHVEIPGQLSLFDASEYNASG